MRTEFYFHSAFAHRSPPPGFIDWDSLPHRASSQPGQPRPPGYLDASARAATLRTSCVSLPWGGRAVSALSIFTWLPGRCHLSQSLIGSSPLIPSLPGRPFCSFLHWHPEVRNHPAPAPHAAQALGEAFLSVWGSLAPLGEGSGQEPGLLPPRRRHAGLQPQRGEDLQSQLRQVPSRGESGRVLLLAGGPSFLRPVPGSFCWARAGPRPGRPRGEGWYLGKLIGAGRRRPCCHSARNWASG